MAPYSKVNSLVQYSRVSFDLNPRPGVVNFLCDLPFPSARETAALSLPCSAFSNASSKLFSAGASASDVYSSWWRVGVDFFLFFLSFLFEAEIGLRAFPYCFSRGKLAHACRFERNYVKSSLSMPLRSISTSSRQLSLLFLRNEVDSASRCSQTTYRIAVLHVCTYEQK